MKNEHTSVFESIKQINEHGQEYWSGREFYKVIEYKEWRKFSKVVIKAKTACENSGEEVENHFVQVDKMVTIGSGANRKIKDIHLSRYACYLVIQNADPTKHIIALGQTYFAVQTRKQEILEENAQLGQEEEMRIFLRNEMKEHNKKLSETANRAGVVHPREYAVFQNHGYKGLYGGLGSKDIHRKKGLKKSHKILDYMGSTELAANLFRATQTEEKIRRENIKGKQNANNVHYEVGRKVRKTIEELGGTMPEDLPTPKDSVKKLEANKRKLLKAIQAKKLKTLKEKEEKQKKLNFDSDKKNEEE